MNVDKGAQANGGIAASVTGTIANGILCDSAPTADVKAEAAPVAEAKEESPVAEAPATEAKADAPAAETTAQAPAADQNSEAAPATESKPEEGTT